ncbi:AglZ/HisF2 family acetamidino modification protein [Sphingorhabdus buctiana]|uniref:Imidazole glycerol phosphate synthase subunit HisF n=2 Tax=Sphingorhabdus buctiana TaxID=1508805 RepID=A0ABW4MEW1_9SPHN
MHRVIPCLLLSDGGLVKTRKFKNPIYVGDPINAVRIFNDKEVDELVVLDIVASTKGLAPDFTLIEAIASECFIPLAYGGGISTIEHVRTLFRLGVEKVILNTALHVTPDLVKAVVCDYGSQAVVASIDVKRKLFGRWEVTTCSGTKQTGWDPVEFSQYVAGLGVGEILLTSIDNEGSMAGYDIALTSTVSQAVNIPVIASGGAGSLNDLRDAILNGHASAVAAGSMFVLYGPHRAVLISYPEYSVLTELLK